MLLGVDFLAAQTPFACPAGTYCARLASGVHFLVAQTPFASPAGGSFLYRQKGGSPPDRRKRLAQPERDPARLLRRSQKHPTGMFLMDSPCVPLAPARRAFQLQTATAVCHQKTRRPSSRVPPSVQGGGLPSFFFYRKKKEAKKNAPFGKAFRPLRRATGALPLDPASL